MRESLTLLPGSTFSRFVRFTGLSFSSDQRGSLTRDDAILLRRNVPIANLENVENDHPDKAIDPHPYDSRQWNGWDAYADVTNQDCCNLGCNDCPEKPGAGIRRLEDKMLGANDEQQQMSADG